MVSAGPHSGIASGRSSGPGSSNADMEYSSYLSGGIATPCRVGGQMLALHQEGVGSERHVVFHFDAVMDEGVAADGAAVADADVVGLEGAILQRVSLDRHHPVDRAVVADRHKRLLRDAAAVVEQLPADLDAQQPPDHSLERRAREQVEIEDLAQLPVALVLPVIIVVDGAGLRTEFAEPDAGMLDQGIVRD